MTTPDNTNPTPPLSAPVTSAPAPLPVASAPAAAAPGPKPSLQERKLFNFYRPEEGHRARALIGIAIAVILLYGCHSLWGWLPTEGVWGQKLFDFGDDQFAVTPGLAISLGLALAFLFGTFRLINYPRFVDFLIDTENELKKVSWASRRQVISESIVVLATVIIIGVYVFLVDLLLQAIKRLDWNAIFQKLGL